MKLATPDWLESYGENLSPVEEEGWRWIKDRPRSVHAAMILFPPSCVVRIAKTQCPCLHHGQYGIIRVYYEGGLIGFTVDPDDDTIHKAAPADMEVVKFWNGVTSGEVKLALSS